LSPQDTGAAFPIGVYKMSEFSWCGDEWMAQMIAGFAALQKAGAKKFVVDLTDNGGGYLCTSQAMVKLLTSGRAQPFLTDLRLTKGMMKVVAGTWKGNDTNSDLYPGGMVDGITNQIYTDLSILNGVPRITPTGKLVKDIKSSRKCYDSCDPYFTWGNFTIPFKPDEIALVSDGYCGSSCALTASQLHEYQPETKLVVTTSFSDDYVSGWRNNEWNFISFPGSEVYDTTSLLADVQFVNGTEADGLDVAFPTQSTLSFCLREAWSRKIPDQVLEYFRWGTNLAVKMTAANTLRPQKIWADVAKKVGWF